MGQKTNPKAFRLITNQNHLSNWYSDKKYYFYLLKEDFYIRNFLNIKLANFIEISNIEIERTTYKNQNPINIRITALYPKKQDFLKKIGLNFDNIMKNKNFLYTFQKNNDMSIKKNNNLVLINQKKLLLLYFQNELKKIIKDLEIKTNKQFLVSFKFLKTPYDDALLLAKNIGEQIKRRIPFRRVIKQILKKYILNELAGIKIQISGRLNGAEIARSEWKREGKIPLQTLAAKVDYTSYFVNTIYGTIGIKIWLFKK